jgi:oligopeptide/dipeptide ABC transporter ATP-binding protein
MSLLVELEGLKVYFYDQGDKRFIRACENIGFGIRENKVLGVVGESGCGKTVTALSMMGLIDGEPGVIGGKFFFKPKQEDRRALIRAAMRGSRRGKDFRRGEVFDLFYGLKSSVKYEQFPYTIIKDSERWLRRNNRIMERIRGKNISMVFQNPSQSLNPFVPVGAQLEKTLKCLSDGYGNKRMESEAAELLRGVRIYNPKAVMNMYPDALSLGMAQRVVIAISLACCPKLLIADEPTTGLDTTNKYRVIELLKETIDQRDMALMLISHNIGIVGLIADDIAVMYSGIIVERGGRQQTITTKRSPKHPYTEALVSSVPTDADIKRGKRLKVIPGIVPNNKMEIVGCPFLDRCPYAVGKMRRKCRTVCPKPFEVDKGHFIRCYLYEN